MHKMRNSSGAGMIASALFAAFFIILPLAILAFEYTRFSVAQLQLRSICDASALSGACGVASAQNSDPATAHGQAMDFAFETFRQNMLMGASLGDPSVCSVHKNDGFRPTTAPAGKCIVAYTLLDQNYNPVPTGDTRAKLIRCEAVFGYTPPIGGALGFTDVPLLAYSEGGLPSLDIVMCFDISGSMDDQTPVSLVKRYYDTTNGYTRYDVVSVNRDLRNNLPFSAINNVLEPAPSTGNGTKVNASAPQNLHFTGQSSADYTSGNVHPYNFLPNLRVAPAVASEVGAPPGNVTDPSMSLGGGTDYTDLVVNLNYDANGRYVATNDGPTGLSFPNVGTLVEASRGNLDLDNAGLDTAVPNHNDSRSLGSTVTPDTALKRYRDTYLKLADARIQPMAAARTAAQGFFDTMNISANCHFGFVAFADTIGTDKDSVVNFDPTDEPPAFGKSLGTPIAAPLPLVQLADVNADPLNTRYQDCKDAVGKLRATGATNIARSLDEAIAELTTTASPLRTRQKARRCIVLFTDGIPTLPGSSVGGSGSTAARACYDLATTARGKIKIYAIGLSQNRTVRPTMQRVLDGITRPTGGQYFLVDNPTQLNKAFQDIAKALIVLR